MRKQETFEPLAAADDRDDSDSKNQSTTHSHTNTNDTRSTQSKDLPNELLPDWKKKMETI